MPKFITFNDDPLFDLPPAAGLSAEEKKETFFKYQMTQLQIFYSSKLKKLDSSAFQALSDDYATTRRQLIEFASSTWKEDGLLFFREIIHEAWRDRAEITNKPKQECPITFTADELSAHSSEIQIWDEFKQQFDSLGIPLDGWVHSEDFNSKAEAMQTLVREILNSAADNEDVRLALRAWKLSDQSLPSYHPMSWIFDYFLYHRATCGLHTYCQNKRLSMSKQK
ncbi:hypothetical protein PHISCL_06997 [Aspergillus sclerotialis]|uniref:Uncharacterized protein n=1 Tax=Aspergillus sclerotialis TaxID=2070753 RepID=A0A3A2ZCM0_9EURO|nr:hypothetical protein PHISCL_06997 [Aspergillus sclerotialis]